MNTQEQRANAMEKFLFFTANFPNEFIDKCWKDDKIMMDHFKEKFDSIWFCGSTNGLETMLKFCFALDITNREKLFKWIDENYNHRIALTAGAKTPLKKWAVPYIFVDGDVFAGDVSEAVPNVIIAEAENVDFALIWAYDEIIQSKLKSGMEPPINVWYVNDERFGESSYEGWVLGRPVEII
jgi:hypothetical protein